MNDAPQDSSSSESVSLESVSSESVTPASVSPESVSPESVWDYPRPPLVVPTGEEVRVILGGREVASTTEAVRVLETSHPPTYYLPAAAFVDGVLRPAVQDQQTFCEFKGLATYWDLVVEGATLSRAGWSYPSPTQGFEALIGHVALMPGSIDGATCPQDGCFVDGERVLAQEGGFYGGWITSRVIGPFKGAPGTRGW